MTRASHNLPGVLGEIAEIAGVAAALAVAEKVGGTRAYIARRPDANHWLVRAVGEEAAAKIVDHFTTGRTGAEIEFPVGPAGTYNHERRQRRRRLAELTGQGLPTVKVARQVGITERSVRRFKVAVRDRADDPQGDLGF